MKIQPMVSYEMKHGSGWLTASAFFSGFAIFCIAIYYFVLTDFSLLKPGVLALQVILPLVWYVGFSAVMQGFHVKAPLVYGVFAAVYCLLMIFWGFVEPTVLGSVGGLVFYLVAGAAMVATALGYIPGKYFLATAFGAVVLMQIFWKDISVYIVPLELKAYLPSLARTCGVASLSLLCFGMKGSPVPGINTNS